MLPGAVKRRKKTLRAIGKREKERGEIFAVFVVAMTRLPANDVSMSSLARM